MSQPIHHTANEQEYLLVQVRPGSVRQEAMGQFLRFYFGRGFASRLTAIDVPPGTWQILGIAAELTEEQCAALIGPEIWEKYEAVQYLCKRHGLSPWNTLILKKV